MKRILSNGVVVALLCTGGVSRSWAGGVGTSAAEFLKIGVGARAVGMGEAYVAQADDVSSLYWNPGGLALMQERQASFMYSQFLKDAGYSHGALGIPLESGAIGGSYSYLGYGQINGYDINGNPIGDQKAYSSVGTLGGAWLGNQWSLGFNLKGIQQGLADEKATAFAFDVGTTLIYPQPFLNGTLRFGFVYQNIGQSVKYLQQSDPLPSQWKVGVAAVQLMNKKLNVALDFGKPRDDSTIMGGGVEYWLNSYFALRTGYASTHTEGNGVRAGMGLKIKGILFDYAYSNYGELGLAHRYELSLRFGEPRPILTAEEYKVLKQAKAAMRQGRYDQAVLLFDSLIQMEPRYRPARRLVKVAMANMEDQQKEMLARQGKSYEPGVTNAAQKPAVMTDLDDLEQLLNQGEPKAAAVPANKTGGKTTLPGVKQQ